MIKRIVAFFKKHMHFKIIELPLILVFLIMMGSVYYFVSNLPKEKYNYVAQEISLLSKKSETGSVPMYFDQNSNIVVENSAITTNISKFNNYNNSITEVKEYKELVCANLDDSEVKVNVLEDKSPAVIMTSWSTFYYDEVVKDNVFMSNLMVEGLGKTSVSRTSFCYITSKQADYIVNRNHIYNKHEDLINEEINIDITYSGKTKNETFIIRDIIKSDVGNDTRFNELFGSYIVCYYLPFLKTTKYQMLYDLSKDVNRNLTLLNEMKESYSYDAYTLKFLNGVDEKQADFIRNELFKKEEEKDNSVLTLILLYIPGLVFAFSVFFICESKREIHLSLSLILFGAFTLEYILLFLLVRLDVIFAVKLFTSTGILCNFGLLLFILLIIGISTFVKDNTKFNRKYVNEKCVK